MSVTTGYIKPWGSYSITLESSKCKVKTVEVEPKHRLSYQYHTKRDENWVIIQGIAKVTIDGKIEYLKAGNQTTIKRLQKHRVENVGKELLIFIEVQTGEYFGEDDIVRIEDDYDRV